MTTVGSSFNELCWCRKLETLVCRLFASQSSTNS